MVKFDAVVGFSVNPELTWTGIPNLVPGQKCPAEAHFHISGTSYDVAWAIKSCGFEPLLIGAVGLNDPVNGFLRTALEDQGISHHLLELRDKTPWANVEPESDRRLSFKPPILNENDGFVRDAVAKINSKFQIVTGLMPDPNEIELAKILLTKNGGIRVLNPRKALTADRQLFKEVAKHSDWLFLNRIEAAAYLGHSPYDLAPRYLNPFIDLGLKLIAVTMDKDGAMILDNNGLELEVPAYNTGKEVVDTTGAGDCFLGFFIASLLKGCDFKTALRRAVVASGIKVTLLGSANVPTYDEVLEVDKV